MTANDDYTEKCVEFGLLPYLKTWAQRLHSKNINDHKLKEICWALSNVTAGTKAQIIAVIKSNVFPILINILQCSRTNIANEALWAIANATSCGNHAIIEYLVNQGLVKAFCSYFKNRFFPYNKNLDKTLMVALECIDNLLFSDKAVNETVAIKFEENGGLTFLETLQSSDNISEDIYHKVIHIIKTLGVDDEQEVIELNNNAIGDGIDISCNINNDNQFGFGLNKQMRQNQQQNYFNFD